MLGWKRDGDKDRTGKRGPSQYSSRSYAESQRLYVLNR